MASSHRSGSCSVVKLSDIFIFTIESIWTGYLALLSYVSRLTLTFTSDRVTKCLILTFTSLGTGRTIEALSANCKSDTRIENLSYRDSMVRQNRDASI